MSFHDFIERAWAYGVRPKSRRKITAQQMYPWAVERQLQADLKAEFVKAGTYYKEQALNGTQSFKDNAEDLADAEYDNDERLKPLAERVAYEVEKFQQACFENFSDVVIGERYVPAVVGPSITDTWQENFLTLCRSANDDLKRKVSAIISDAVMNGNNIADTARQIDEAVGHYSYSKAMTIARTETGKLNMAISKAQMEEAGIDKYEWSCMMDERSRPSHEKMDGKICIWSNPNVVYNIKTKKTEPRPQSAVHLHPGDDYNCRCVALPWDELIEEELNQKKGKPNKQWLELKEQEKQKAAEKRAEREEIKRNKELVPQLTAENEKLQKRLDKMSQELLEEQLEREGLEETLARNSIEGEPHEEVLHVHSDNGKEAYVVVARTRQEAKYALWLDIKNHPENYGSNATIPKFSPEKYKGPTPVVEIRKESENKVAKKKQTKSATTISNKTENFVSTSSATSATTYNVSNKKIPQDVIDLSDGIKSGKISMSELNQQLFNGDMYITNIEYFKNLPDSVRTEVIASIKSHRVRDVTGVGGCSYAKEDGIFINRYSLRPTTVIHEATHVIDLNLSNKRSKSISEKFGHSIKDEFLNGFLSDVKSSSDFEKKLRNLVSEFRGSKGYKDDSRTLMTTLRDWTGLSGRTELGRAHSIDYAERQENSAILYGHSKDEAKYAALSLESFAELSELLSYEVGQKFLAKYLPNTLKKYYFILGVNP